MLSFRRIYLLEGDWSAIANVSFHRIDLVLNFSLPRRREPNWLRHGVADIIVNKEPKSNQSDEKHTRDCLFAFVMGLKVYFRPISP